MFGTEPQNVRHWCRKCGRSFESSGVEGRAAARSAHGQLVRHFRRDHGFRAASACHSNCSFKATYLETQDGRMYYGAGRGW